MAAVFSTGLSAANALAADAQGGANVAGGRTPGATSTINKEPRPVSYNPDIPIEEFDVIIIDECHRSIYNLWRQVLEYFDAFLIGLTATPTKKTIGFFNQNLVSEYTHEDAVVDKVNVGYDIYRIKTELTEQGNKIEAGTAVEIRDRLTKQKRLEVLDQEEEWLARQLDRSEQTWVRSVMGDNASLDGFQEGVGCNQCNHTGYHGRIGVYELLEIDYTLADALRITLLGEDEQRLDQIASTDVDVYDLYLKGRDETRKGGFVNLERAEDYYQQALTLDPDYTPARLGLINNWGRMAATGAMAIDDAVARMLRAQLSLPTDEDGTAYPSAVRGSAHHRALAREARERTERGERFFEETLKREISRAVRYKRPLALILFDIDPFKEIGVVLTHDSSWILSLDSGGATFLRASPTALVNYNKHRFSAL